jgi:hypothetical protein
MMERKWEWITFFQDVLSLAEDKEKIVIGDKLWCFAYGSKQSDGTEWVGKKLPKLTNVISKTSLEDNTHHLFIR